MKIKNIINEFGRKVQIDELTRKLYKYNNENETISYNAEIVENGKKTGQWTNYTEKGRIDSIEERLKVWNNKIMFLYSAFVGFNSPKNDPKGEKYNKVLEFVKLNPEKFFDENGDFHEKFLIKTGNFSEGFSVEDEEIKSFFKSLR